MAEESLRDSISSAFDKAEDEEKLDTPAGETVLEASAEELAPETLPETPPGDTPTPETPPGDTPPPETPPETPPIVQADPNDKPPGTWTPLAREKWGKVDPDIKAEVWKREREASRALNMSADARRLEQEFNRTIQPYMTFIAAENSTPLNAVQNMMATAAVLRIGTQEQKVRLVADTIRRFGVDLRALDSVLAGQQPQFDPASSIQTEIQKALAPFRQQQEQQARFAAEQLDREVDQELDTFIADPKHEFYGDVKDTMADLIQLAAQKGQSMGLTDAYDRAILMHEPVRRVIAARQQTNGLLSGTKAAQRARGAAVSVTPSSSVQGQAPEPNTIRGAIEAAIAKTEGR
jgi:hypothetical protein